MTTALYPHIELDQSGEPVISGANTKVLVVAMDRLAHHWDANEIQREHPHLTLGQIYSALAYYYDNELEMNQLLEKGLHREASLLGQLGESRLRTKLLTAKRSA